MTRNNIGTATWAPEKCSGNAVAGVHWRATYISLALLPSEISLLRQDIWCYIELAVDHNSTLNYYILPSSESISEFTKSDKSNCKLRLQIFIT